MGQKIGALYRMYMDSVSRNRMGFDPIKPALAKVAAINDRKQVQHVMYEPGRQGLRNEAFRVWHRPGCHQL